MPFGFPEEADETHAHTHKHTHTHIREDTSNEGGGGHEEGRDKSAGGEGGCARRVAERVLDRAVMQVNFFLKLIEVV